MGEDEEEDLLLPTVTINQIVQVTETFIYCTSENEDGTCASTACDTWDVKTYKVIAGYVMSATGQFGVSYGNNGFFINDGTGGIFVNVDESFVTKLPVGTPVHVYDASGTCLYGTKQLENGVIEVIKEDTDAPLLLLPGVVPVPAAIRFPPSQIGQF